MLLTTSWTQRLRASTFLYLESQQSSTGNKILEWPQTTQNTKRVLEVLVREKKNKLLVTDECQQA